MSIDAIKKSAAERNLIIILGAGASIALTTKSKNALTWPSLVKSGLDYTKIRGIISEKQLERHIESIVSGDMDELLGVAEFVGRKLDAPLGDSYARWLQQVFEKGQPEPGGMLNALKTIADLEIPIATLNYDTLAEHSTGLPTIDFADTPNLLRWLRKENRGVLHIHGVWSNPRGCIFGIRDYQAAVDDQLRNTFQKSLSSLNRLLFVGCGDTFADPNFFGLITWLRTNLGANYPQHYALVRNDEVDSKFADRTWHGFVDPIGYGDKYSDLPGFLLSCFPTKQSPKTPASKTRTASAQHIQTLDAYRLFLMRDCGQMAIEGMPGDMETGQRKFDIEKLFVPLQVIGVNPKNHEANDAKTSDVTEWQKRYADPIDFSKAFENERAIALLALPGGGKTLLLKRLAVAYANPARHKLCDDKLPQIALIPIMIRCREWKEQIRQPIVNLLKNISAITGDHAIDKLFLAVEKHLKAGTALLLIDGLDEIHSDADRTIFVDNIEKFLDLYPKIRLVVTSREAGFELIAPALSRFCAKFRMASLNSEAIKSLCEYWHRLMGGGSPDSMNEAKEVFDTLMSSSSLKLLAGNPLLCTMLLVVKHGFGRLPTDRVTLYERAVELLLDTWNIRGHDALNVKEAVPQLAFVAFELLKRGKQTATEKELLEILENARLRNPMIGRYAKDSPHAFIKRVELRSSLVLQGGHKNEDGRIVPFYQFRHLTFQEYLSAVAAVEGYVLEGPRPHTIMHALGDNLLSDEWKEVIPMAARLGRAQAEPLLEALIVEARSERDNFIAQPALILPFSSDTAVPPATARIARSMVEEAFLSPDMLSDAASIISMFANGCAAGDNWAALCQGPYGPDLRSAALDLYMEQPHFARCRSRNTVALFESMSRSFQYWHGDDCEKGTISLINSNNEREIVKGLLGACGSFWQYRTESYIGTKKNMYEIFEKALSNKSEKVQIAASWAWGFWRHINFQERTDAPLASPYAIKYLSHMFINQFIEDSSVYKFSIPWFGEIERGSIDLPLTDAQTLALRLSLTQKTDGRLSEGSDTFAAAAQIAFVISGFIDNRELVQLIKNNKTSYSRERSMDRMLVAMGEVSKLKTRGISRKGGQRNTPDETS